MVVSSATAGSAKRGAASPGATGVAKAVMSWAPCGTSAEEREDHERVGLEARALADVPCLGEVGLGLRQAPGIEVQRRQAIVAGEEQLRLADPLGQLQRLL